MEAGTLSIILFATLLGLLATGIWVGPVLLAVGAPARRLMDRTPVIRSEEYERVIPHATCMECISYIANAFIQACAHAVENSAGSVVLG